MAPARARRSAAVIAAAAEPICNVAHHTEPRRGALRFFALLPSPEAAAVALKHHTPEVEALLSNGIRIVFHEGLTEDDILGAAEALRKIARRYTT